MRRGILQTDTFTARPLEVLPLFFFFGSGSPLRQSLGSNDGPRFLDAVLELGKSLLSSLASSLVGLVTLEQVALLLPNGSVSCKQ